MPAAPLGRALRAGLPVLAVIAVLAGCGGDDDRYADAWSASCRALEDGARELQQALVSAADQTPDTGDAAARSALPAAVVGREAGPAAERFSRAVATELRQVREVAPPDGLRAWHRAAIADLERQARVVADGADRVRRGDAAGLAALALGGVGPARADAPAVLRDETPDCTALR
ncbi:hypothetical protein SK069_18405 [Patulibacter brassicae]|jgi:hypothetical protein|uniref:Lipoprotein n=1 Tax=Patulibacter brassicae TaxID=1705717 RepID=A0ABU4VNY7_9ACTN|nr:hypothetical protein [Patulibacter brassicae]MDX8153576.1 hypothetical protein [Patulibacter brassicae]